MPTITILPLGRILDVERGTLLRDALKNARIMLDYPCGGKGSCRQCRVRVDPPPDDGRGRLRESEWAAGLRLACQLPVAEDCTVTIPDARSSRQQWQQGLRDKDIDVASENSSVRRVEVTLPEPHLGDQRADWERLVSGLAERGISAGPPDSSALEHLSSILRESGWKVDALCEESDLVALGRASAGSCLGFAVDLGTTTVDLALLDLESGKRIARSAFLNGQVSFGADVISRAQSFHADRAPVRDAALRTIDEGARRMLEEAGIPPGRVVKTVVVGNPIMIHILNGIDPWQLTLVPYVPLVAGSVRRPPRDFGWTFQESGYVETLPLVSAYVGADTIGMIVALDLEQEGATSLSIDIGTNGEMVLAQSGKLLATSTAAGPAFEGAEISCGMRALDGAIYDVAISGDGTLELQVVGRGLPRGICGTGLISGVAALLSLRGRRCDGKNRGPLRGGATGAQGEGLFPRRRAGIRPVGGPRGLHLPDRHQKTPARQGRRPHGHRDAPRGERLGRGGAGCPPTRRQLRRGPRCRGGNAHRAHSPDGPRTGAGGRQRGAARGNHGPALTRPLAEMRRARRATRSSSSSEESPSSRPDSWIR